jgi:hypothetical protein
MITMTPLQSWALLILFFGAIIMLVWALAGSRAQAVAVADADADEQHDEALPRLAEIIPFPGARTEAPATRAPVSQASAAEHPYDWAVDGL